jgi:hypothetical protein
MKHKTINRFFPVLVLTSVASFAIAQIVINKDRFNISEATQVQPKTQQVISYDKVAVYQNAPAETEAHYKGWIAQQAEIKEGADWGHVIVDASCPNGCIVIGNGPDPYADLPESNEASGIGGEVSVPGGGGDSGVPGGGGGSGSGSSEAEKREQERRERERREYEQKVSNLRAQLSSLNSQLGTLATQAQAAEGVLNLAIAAFNSAAQQRNIAASGMHRWLQSKSNSETEVKNFTKVIQEKNATLEQRKKDLQNLIDQTNSQSVLINQTFENKVKPGTQAVNNSSVNLGNRSVANANLHNKSIAGIEQTARIDKSLINSNTTPSDFAKSIEAAKADMSGVVTPKDSPYYRDLAYTKSDLDQARAKVSIAPLSEDQRKNLSAALDISELLFSIADLQFSLGDGATGDMVLARSHQVIGQVFDTLSDIAPGVSLLKDLISLGTGVNPVTFESVGDVEMAIISGALLVPGAAKLAGKRVSQAAEWLSKVVAKHQSAKAEKILDIIKKADEQLDEIVDEADCLTYSKPSIWEYISLIPTAYACPGKVGKSVDVVEKSAEAAGVTNPKSVAKYADLAKKHEVELKKLTPDQNKRLGDLANGEWSPHQFKHVRARTEVQARDMSSNGGPAQYMPGLRNKEIEEKALIYGQVIPKQSGYHIYYRSDDFIGYANGKKTRWVRAEYSGNTYHGHPRDILDVRREIGNALE